MNEPDLWKKERQISWSGDFIRFCKEHEPEYEKYFDEIKRYGGNNDTFFKLAIYIFYLKGVEDGKQMAFDDIEPDINEGYL